MLTLEQALIYNKGLIKTNQQDPRTIKRWYALGYYLKDDGGWYMSASGKEYRKYSTY